jgi:hypothetical protein
MSADLIAELRIDAEMLRDGWQKNLTKLWHSEVVKDAASDCVKAADALEAALSERDALKAEEVEWKEAVQGEYNRAEHHKAKRAEAEARVTALEKALAYCNEICTHAVTHYKGCVPAKIRREIHVHVAAALSPKLGEEKR